MRRLGAWRDLFGTEDVHEDGRQNTGIVMGEIIEKLKGCTKALHLLDKRFLEEVLSPWKVSMAGPLR